MKNTPIHIPPSINSVIVKRGYMLVYLPLYSPELNLIVQFWAILKKVKRSKFNDVETLSSRMIKASEAAPVEHHDFVQLSVNLFDECRNKEFI
jgi:transposase